MMKLLFAPILLAVAVTGCSGLHPSCCQKVRVISPEPPPGVIPSRAGFSNIVEAAVEELKDRPVRVLRAELIAWSVRLDHLEAPPRIGEDAVVLLNIAHQSGAHGWALAYLWRMPGEGRAVDHWRVPGFPPPFATVTEFPSEPSETQIAHFISASDFAYHACRPDEVVIDAAVYRRSAAIRKAASEIPSRGERRRRYDRYVGSIPY